MKLYKKPTVISSNSVLKLEGNKIVPLAMVTVAAMAEAAAAAAATAAVTSMMKIDFATPKERLIPAV